MGIFYRSYHTYATILTYDLYRENFEILKITNTSKSIRNRQTQIFSQLIDQWQQKNEWYKFGGASLRYKPHPTVWGTTIILPLQERSLASHSMRPALHLVRMVSYPFSFVLLSHNLPLWATICLSWPRNDIAVFPRLMTQCAQLACLLTASL